VSSGIGHAAPDPAPDRAEVASALRRALTIQITAANVAGALILGVFLVWVIPLPGVPRAKGLTANLIVGFAYLVLASATGQRLGLRTAAPVSAWLEAGREPDPGERDATLRQASLQARNVAGLWLGAVALFAVVNAFVSGAVALEVGIGVLMGGITTTALCYLMAERSMRTAIALALEREPPRHPVTPGVTTRIVLAWSCGTGVALLGAALVSAEFLAAGNVTGTRLAVTVLSLSAAALLIGLATAAFAARSVADPLQSIRRALSEVEAGNTDVVVPVYDSSEVGLLQAGFNSMVAGLRERERIRDLFGRHVGHDVAQQALARGIELGGETREAAVMFVDLIGSTAFAASNEPSVVVAALNRFFALVVEVTATHGGWVNKFEGDAALCVFGALDEHPDSAGAALAAGRELSVRLGRELGDLPAGLGIAAGEVVAGNIGAADRYEYTVIGDPVNAAARLADLAKQSPERVLAADVVLERADDAERRLWRLGETVTLRGRPTPTRVATPAASSGT
jgi:adenylate cyclase